MKTDLVLTRGEYLAMCCHVPKHVDPPGKDARHIPITAEDHGGMKNNGQRCTCDRWGHPYPDCTDEKHGQRVTLRDFGNKNRGETKWNTLL